MIVIKSPREIKALRNSGQIVARICQRLVKEVKPGITTKQLDNIASELIKKYNAKPAFLGYRGFPATICTSINKQVVHGIPGETVLNPGDIISLDVGVMAEEYCGDMAVTVPVGEVSKDTRKLLQVTEESLYKGIKQANVSSYLGDISHAIQACAEENGFSVVRDFVGHGIGRQMHEDPQIPNYGHPGQGPRLSAGMVLALEPMVNMGSWQVKVLSDGWTVVTADGKLSCHFEHMVAITDNGPEILTLLDK
jgi:methionyl aminopeptidase